MELTRIFTGSDQQSHFQDVELELMESVFGELTKATAVENIIFGEIDEPREVSWHNPPHRQYVVMLHGAVEIEIGDGTKRIFKEGDIILAEDTTGQGHITRAVSEGLRRYMVIH